MLFGIIDENKKFILIDENRERLRDTALILATKIDEKYIPMFDNENIDNVISEYNEQDIETAYTGDKYVKGFAPEINQEYQSKQREKAYQAEVDPITAHIVRLRDMNEKSPEIDELIAKREAKVKEIKEKYPY